MTQQTTPQPLAPQGQPRTMLDRAREALNARMTKDALRLVLENVITYADGLRTRVGELEAERHSTNESLSEAAEALRRQRERIEEQRGQLAAARVPYRERAARETSPARRAAWRQLAVAEEAEARLERLLAAPADDDPEAGDAS